MSLTVHLATSVPQLQKGCPAEVFRKALEEVRRRGGSLYVCRFEGVCGWPPPRADVCQKCFKVPFGDQTDWAVLYQRYLHGDA